MKIKKQLIKLYKNTIGRINNFRIKNKNLTIISNNCWGGIFYRDNNLKYLSPTCGLFFIGQEYIKFIYNLKKYINIDKIKFINVNESKYKDYLNKIQYKGIIGKIDDLEICFMHYKTQKEVLEKWNRRKKRINWNNILYKFNDQNYCRYEDLKKFNEFEADRKICFTAKNYNEFDTIQIKKYEKYEYVLDDIKSYKKYFNMHKFINMKGKK